MRNDQFVGKRKLKDHWGDKVYTVCNQIDMDVPVYIKNQRGQRQTLHRNQLFLIAKVDPKVDLQVAVRLLNVASTQISSEVQHREMLEASTPPIKIQAYAACLLSIDAQNVKESKLWELITSAYKALWAIYAGWWLNKEWGQKFFVVWMPTGYNLGGHEMGLQLALHQHTVHDESFSSVAPVHVNSGGAQAVPSTSVLRNIPTTSLIMDKQKFSPESINRLKALMSKENRIQTLIKVGMEEATTRFDAHTSQDEASHDGNISEVDEEDVEVIPDKIDDEQTEGS